MECGQGTNVDAAAAVQSSRPSTRTSVCAPIDACRDDFLEIDDGFNKMASQFLSNLVGDGNEKNTAY